MADEISSHAIPLNDALTLYFSDFLAAKKNQSLLPKLRKLNVTFRIVLQPPVAQMWTLTIKDGMLISVLQGESDSQCAFRLKPETFLQIAAGKLSPQMAFFKRQVDIEGEIDTGLKLATVLAEFFQRFPYHTGPTE